MKNEQFTPGPWRIEKGTHLGSDGRFVHHLFKGTEVKPLWFMNMEFYSPDGDITDHANMNLVKAAPDMYEALKFCFHNATGLSAASLEMIEAALSKANPQSVTIK